jgi:hypothetical protein
MAYTYRLSRRLAQVHAGLLVAFSLACTDSNSPSDSGISPAADGPQFISNSSGTGSCRNEPAGYSLISDQPFNALPAKYPGFDALGWQLMAMPFRFSLVSDPTSPSGGKVIRGLFRKGAKGGSAPFRMDRPLKKNYKALYMCVSTKISSNFTTNGNSGIKFGFFETPYDWSIANGINHYLDLYPKLAINLQFKTPAITNRNLVSTFNMSLHKNEWHVVEVLLVGNSTGQKNGVARMWVDGNQVLSATNVQYFYPGQTAKFDRITWNPTYGGGLNPVPYDMEQFIDGWYLSGQ